MLIQNFLYCQQIPEYDQNGLQGNAKETTVKCPSSPQAAMHEKRSCYHNEYTHKGSEVVWKIIVT